MKNFILTFFFFLTAAAHGQLVRVADDGWAATSVNTAVFRGAAVVSHGDKQYTAYYDAEGYVVLASRAVDGDTWQTCRTQYRGNVRDGHNVISIGVDGDGRLHCAFDHHGSPLHYAVATAPGALTLGDMQPMTGSDEQDVTYPEFYSMAGGDLLFAYRSGASGRGNLVLNRYDIATHTWQRLHSVLIDGQGQRNAYWQLFCDPAGAIHLSWVWRETWLVETNHDVCYAVSRDGGRSWQRSDGTPYTLPITQATAEVAWHVPQHSNLINQTSMTADADGHPYIATYWSEGNNASEEDNIDKSVKSVKSVVTPSVKSVESVVTPSAKSVKSVVTPSVPQYRLVWHDGSRWRMEQVGQRHTPFSLAGGGTKMIPIARPRIVSDGRAAWLVFRDQERGSRVSMAYTPWLGHEPWTTTDLTDFSVDAWEPAHDINMWNTRQRLDIFVQTTHQGDGERLSLTTKPTTVYVMTIGK